MVERDNLIRRFGAVLDDIDPDGKTEFLWSELRVKDVWGGKVGPVDQRDIVSLRGNVLDLG